MLRFALTAYLCLATVVGPGFCCCTLKQISSGGAMRRHSCCNRSVAVSAESGTQNSSQRRDAAEQRHTSDRISQVSTGGPASPLPSSRPIAANAPQSPQRGHSCPCNQQHLNAVAANVVKANGSAEPITTASNFLYCALPPEFVADATDLSTRSKDQFSNGPPAQLAGREILRAYQILQC